jgi:cytoskeletal protein RodZ
MVRNTYEVQNIGDLLRDKRKSMGVSLKQVAEKTKIRVEYLLALENGKYDKFASAVYVKGFLKKYAKFLGINPERAVAMYRREQDKDIRGKLRGTDFFEGVGKAPSFDLSLNKVISFIILLLILAFGYYLISQASVVFSTPSLAITVPVDVKAGEEKVYTTDKDKLSLRGAVDPGSNLKLNGRDIKVDQLSQFAIEDFSLTPGENDLEFVVTNQFGGSSSLKLKVVSTPATGVTPTPTGTSTVTPTTQLGNNKMKAKVTAENRDAYVEVTIDGKIILAETIKVGNSKTFESTKPFKFSTPRPDAVKLEINGQQYKLEQNDYRFSITPEGAVVVEKI